MIVFRGYLTSSGIAQGNSRDVQRYQGKFPRLPLSQSHPFSVVLDTVASVSCFHHWVISSLQIRGLQFPGRPDRLICSDNARHARCLCSAPSRPDRQLYPSEVLRAGRGRVRGQPDVAHAPELSWREARRTERRSEAIPYVRYVSSPFLPFLPFSFVHNAHPADRTRLRTRAASLSSTHTHTCTTENRFFFLTLLMKRSQVVLVDRYDRYRLLTSSTPTMTNTSTLMWKVPVMLKRGKTGNGIRPGENLAIAKMFVECLPMSRLLSTPLVSKESQS